MFLPLIDIAISTPARILAHSFDYILVNISDISFDFFLLYSIWQRLLFEFLNLGVKLLRVKGLKLHLNFFLNDFVMLSVTFGKYCIERLLCLCTLNAFDTYEKGSVAKNWIPTKHWKLIYVYWMIFVIYFLQQNK